MKSNNDNSKLKLVKGYAFLIIVVIAIRICIPLVLYSTNTDNNKTEEYDTNEDLTESTIALVESSDYSGPDTEEENIHQDNEDNYENINSLANYQFNQLRSVSDTMYNDFLNDKEQGIKSKELLIINLLSLDDLCLIIQNMQTTDINNLILRTNVNIQLGLLIEDNQMKIKHYDQAIELCNFALSLEMPDFNRNFFTYYKGVSLLEAGKRVDSQEKINVLISARECLSSLTGYEDFSRHQYLLLLGNLLYIETSDISHLENALIDFDQVMSLNINDKVKYSFLKELIDSYYTTGLFYYEKNEKSKYMDLFRTTKRLIESAKLIIPNGQSENGFDSLNEYISGIFKEENNE